MEEIKYKDLIKKLLEVVPELRSRYESEPKWWRNSGPHIIYGDLLNPYLVSLLKSDDQSDKILRRIFIFLETLAKNSDEHVQEVVVVTVLEYLQGNRVLEKARQYMGSSTHRLCREMEEWKP